MPSDHDHTDAFRGASFFESDLSGATFRGCDLRGVKVTDSWLSDVKMSGLVGNFIVNDIDVTSFVETELDRRHPERVQVREMKNAREYQQTWAVLGGLWAETLARAAALPDQARYERVDDEWSLVQTLRHLVFATDAWVGSAVLDRPAPYHPLGVTHTSYPPEDAAALGIDLNARPSFEQVMEARADRVALVDAIVEHLSDTDLERTCERAPAPGYPDEPRTLGRCLRVVMKEECEHRRYAARDLAVLEQR